jgi:glycosyltransferase involved in cell wall biosynthesis
MKVLHVIDSGGLYGAEVMLLNLAGEQIKMGLEPVIASIAEPHIVEKPLEAEAVRRGLRVERFRMRPGPNLPGALDLLRFARKENVDLLHSHGYKGNILLGMVPRMLRKIPVVATLHGSTSMGKMNRMRLYEWLDSVSLNYLDGVVVVSDAMRRGIEHRNLHVINNGIAPHEASHDSPDTVQNPLDSGIAGFCREGFTLGAIGRLSKEKGFDILLDAVRAAADAVPEVRLIILGEGGERTILETKIKSLGIGDRVLMPGYTADARRYLPYFKALVLSSLTEGLPIVILEAMQAGVPIVATRVGGVPNVLKNGETGILVNASDPAMLAKGIIKLNTERDLSSLLAENAKRIVREKFSSRRMAEEYLMVYSGLLSTGLKKYE